MSYQKTILDVIKAQKDYGGLSDGALLLHEKQCEDFEKMNAKIVKIEKDVEELKANTKITDEKVDKILTILTKASNVNFFLNKVIDTKYFWLWLVIITGLIFGVNFEKIMEIFK
jgi:hypothetical protein